MNKNKLIKTIIIFIATLLTLVATSTISYWLGYCNASDKYIDARECKPQRRIRFLQF